jgi:glycosyltransferase involved in cell wall biosynthesis
MTMRIATPQPSGVRAPVAPPLPVSVVIPVFNRELQLERALRSIAAQGRPAAEVIVVDDGCSDGSAEVAARFGARVVAHDRNSGQVAARNTGIGAARQPWIAFLDSDDEWLPGHLQALWELRDGVLFVAGSSINRRPDPSRDRVVGPLGREPLLLRDPWRLVHPQNFVTMSTTMVRRDALLALGGFRAHDGIVEDLDLWVRLLARGPARISPKVSVVYHVHGAQITEDLPRTRAAHMLLADTYKSERWPPSLPARQRGAQGWDELRDAIEQRRLWYAAAKMLWIARSASRSRGVLELLAWRLRVRRASARTCREGGASMALLVASRQRSSLSGELTSRERADLRGHGRLAVLARLVRRPAGAAVVDSPAWGLAARALGVPAIGGRTARSPREPR